MPEISNVAQTELITMVSDLLDLSKELIIRLRKHI